MTTWSLYQYFVRIRNDESDRLVWQGGISTTCRWSERQRLVSRWWKVDGGELGCVISSHTLQNVFCKPMFKSLQLGVFQGRVTDEPLASLSNIFQSHQLVFGWTIPKAVAVLFYIRFEIDRYFSYRSRFIFTESRNWVTWTKINNNSDSRPSIHSIRFAKNTFTLNISMSFVPIL